MLDGADSGSGAARWLAAAAACGMMLIPCVHLLLLRDGLIVDSGTCSCLALCSKTGGSDVWSKLCSAEQHCKCALLRDTTGV